MRQSKILILLILILYCLTGCETIKPIKKRITYFFSQRETYKARSELQVVPHLSTSKDQNIIKVPPNSIFQIVSPNGKKEDHWVVDFYEADQGANEKSANDLQKGLYKIYIEKRTITDPIRMKRIGGMTTGILVVPFKYRKDDVLSGDATIGPYFGFKSEWFTWAISMGLSRISMGLDTDSNVESETGLTFATGLIYSINDDFDLALITGQDRVFGDAANSFEHQGDWWFSFGIGYNFTR